MAGEQGRLVLRNGAVYRGISFGAQRSIAGEVVFNTGMVGYPESFTDPSYRGQILVCTYPLIGNYGVPPLTGSPLPVHVESDRIQISGLVIGDYSAEYSHWQATRSLAAWLQEQGVPAIHGVDTRALTQDLRAQGSLLGKLLVAGDTEYFDPNHTNVVAQVSCTQPITYRGGQKKIVVVDTGVKHHIIRSLLARGVTVIRVPWDYDFVSHIPDFDGVVLANGPGDPKQCTATIQNIRKAMRTELPIFGVCLGNQLLALAAGADTYKLKFGHRGQNQPCTIVGTDRCFITSQNHGFAVNEKRLKSGWEPWFRNANDGTNEGIRHKRKPWMSVQFHPEATPGPEDTGFLFDEFIKLLR